ncbi:MAG: hypothetical protein DCF19_07930 [Pseudanabaena frigida]|uniref:Uncharacterized protein n=1 Tax=Pseudanabaena frigida TaxID=945775 RepID=A0A2W4WAU5_9CYAN|nr:MAG: hypothetical protein DCF19_07930 [Pseudanabaena frigida]
MKLVDTKKVCAITFDRSGTTANCNYANLPIALGQHYKYDKCIKIFNLPSFLGKVIDVVRWIETNSI